MSTARERERERRRRRVAARDVASPGLPEPEAKAPAPPPGVVPLPAWRWRTFPVFMALAVGLFAGVWIGVPAGIASENGNGIAVTILYLGTAVLLGAALSRFTVRWMQSRSWVKPRPAKKR